MNTQNVYSLSSPTTSRTWWTSDFVMMLFWAYDGNWTLGFQAMPGLGLWWTSKSFWHYEASASTEGLIFKVRSKSITEERWHLQLEIVTLKSKRPPPPHPSTIMMYVWFFIKGRRKIADWMLLWLLSLHATRLRTVVLPCLTLSYTESNVSKFVSGPSSETDTFCPPPHHQPRLFISPDNFPCRWEIGMQKAAL